MAGVVAAFAPAPADSPIPSPTPAYSPIQSGTPADSPIQTRRNSSSDRRTVPSISLPALPPELQPTHSSPHLFGSNNGTTASSSHATLIIGVGVGITMVALGLLTLLIYLIMRKKKEMEKPKSPMGGLPLWNKDLIMSPRNPLKTWGKGQSGVFRRFTYKEIQKGTDDFSTIIGRGGFGTVYKARFEDFEAAVKRMNRVSRQGDQEFCKEMEFLGRLHHRHLVTLRGFSVDKNERFLVYEYMPNGSLKEHLHAANKNMLLKWKTRMQIAIDVATALEYLHFYCDPPLCHRDIKPSNILLDERFCAKVADFGLAHTTPSASSKHDPISTDVKGTPGYMDPEYVITQQLTEKSDVYSFGVLLLELITARNAVQENKNLVEWAKQYFVDMSMIPEMLDPDLEDSVDFEEVDRVVSLIKTCTAKEGKSRPTIRQVLRFLHEKLDMDNPDALQQASIRPFPPTPLCE